MRRLRLGIDLGGTKTEIAALSGPAGGGEGAPVQSHEATVRVLDAPGGSEVTWEVTVEPAEAEGMFRDIYQGALDALKAKLEA